MKSNQQCCQNWNTYMENQNAEKLWIREKNRRLFSFGSTFCRATIFDSVGYIVFIKNACISIAILKK